MSTASAAKPKSLSKAPSRKVQHILLASIVESSQDAIFSRKLDGTIVSWNRAAEQIFGHRAAEIIGLNSDRLVPPEKAAESQRLMESIRRGRRVEHFRTVRLRKDGTPVVVSLSAAPLFDGKGRVRGASTIARDITAQCRLEEELLGVSERERRRLGRDLHDGLGQQLAGVELLCRTLAASLAKRRAPETRSARLVATQLQDAIKQTRSLARGLTPVMDSPNGLMLALEDFAVTIRKMWRVNCTFTCEEPVLVADHRAATHLFRIAQEAVANGLRHGRARRLEVCLQRKLKEVRLEIRDFGRGMRGGPSAQGMGLNIMKYRASVLGGSLQVTEMPRRGVLVSCRVPSSRISSASALA